MVNPPVEQLNMRRAWLVDMAVCAVVGVVLGVVGPFGSFFNDALPVRIAYWTVVLLISGLVFGAGLRWAWPKARRAGVSIWVWGPIFVLIASLGPAGVSRVIAIGLWPGIRYAVGPVEWYGQAVLIGLVYVSLYIGLRSTAPRRVVPERPTVVRAPTAWRDRPIVCLQMEDHYVRVHTEAGSELVLMSLSQAIAGVEGVEGLQTHRSWWVARAAVTGVIEEGRMLRLSLANGMESPISRTRVAQLRAAGWL